MISSPLMLRYTISAPELATGVCYRTLHFSTQASDNDRAKQLAVQIAAIPSNELQSEGIAVLKRRLPIHRRCLRLSPSPSVR